MVILIAAQLCIICEKLRAKTSRLFTIVSSFFLVLVPLHAKCQDLDGGKG